MNTKEQHKIALQIIEAYERNMFHLPLYKNGHFWQRAYAVTGDKKYKNILAYFFFIAMPSRLQYFLSCFEKGRYKLKRNPKIKPKKYKNLRALRRLEFYKKNPRNSFYNAVLVDTFMVQKYGLHKTVFKKEFNKIITFIKKEDFRNLYINEDAVRYDSSFTMNSVYYLHDLGIATLKSELASLIREMYMDKEMFLKDDIDDAEYVSLIYSLTHIILADSRYYTRYVRGHQWIIDFFMNNIDEIIKRTKLDVIAEVGLCFKLCKKEQANKKEYEKIINYIVKQVNVKKLANDPEFLEEKEHSYSVIMLLMYNNKRFYNGPDLSKHLIYHKLLPIC